MGFLDSLGVSCVLSSYPSWPGEHGAGHAGRLQEPSLAECEGLVNLPVAPAAAPAPPDAPAGSCGRTKVSGGHGPKFPQVSCALPFSVGIFSWV